MDGEDGVVDQMLLQNQQPLQPQNLVDGDGEVMAPIQHQNLFPLQPQQKAVDGACGVPVQSLKMNQVDLLIIATRSKMRQKHSY